LFDKNNDLHHILYSGEIVRIGGHRVLLSVLLDISKQKKMEENLLKARKMESIGKMAAGIAHDFNNLLQIINGYSQLLLEATNNNSRQFKDLKEINRAGKRASNLVNLLLLFSTKAHKINEKINLNQEIRSVLAYYKENLKNIISIKFKPADNLLITRLDSDHFRILLKNLLDNSKNAIRNKGIKNGKIIISTQNCTLMDQDTNTEIPAVQLNFQDNGCGMDSTTLSHIYDPYFSSKNFDRSGLGLSAIHGIVKSQQGSINCQSNLRKGTTFTIKFPAHIHQPETENS
jgi:signal transduction histidine kinase